MKKYNYLFAVAAGSLIFLSSCKVAGAIFKAGVWSGIFIVAIILGVIIFLFTRSGRK